jgi:hypothetical protein
MAYIVINGGDKDCSNHQQPVCDRYKQLSMKNFGGMNHFNLWKIGELHRLSKKL